MIYVIFTDFRLEVSYLLATAVIVILLAIAPWIVRFTVRKIVSYYRAYQKNDQELYLKYFDPKLKYSSIGPAFSFVAVNRTLDLFRFVFLIVALTFVLKWLFDFAAVPLIARLREEAFSDPLFGLQAIVILLGNFLLFGGGVAWAIWEMTSGFVAAYQEHSEESADS